MRNAPPTPPDDSRDTLGPDERCDDPVPPTRRFSRTDGRFDLPVVTGRTPKQVARRLA